MINGSLKYNRCGAITVIPSSLPPLSSKLNSTKVLGFPDRSTLAGHFTMVPVLNRPDNGFMSLRKPRGGFWTFFCIPALINSVHGRD